MGGRDDVVAAAAENDDAVDIGGAVLLRRPPELGLRKICKIESLTHRSNMEQDLQNLFGLLCTSVLIG